MPKTRKPTPGRKKSGRTKSGRIRPRTHGHPTRANMIGRAQLRKELAFIKKIHPPSAHKQEKQVLRQIQKAEWLHVPSDKEIKAEISAMNKLEAQVQRLLTPMRLNYPRLPAVVPEPLKKQGYHACIKKNKKK